MQLYILFEPRDITLPIHYHHAVQSMLYQAIANKQYSAKLHDKGLQHEARPFKFFSFSRLYGPHQITNGAIHYFDGIRLKVRSIDPIFMDHIRFGFAEGTVHTLFDIPLRVYSCDFSDQRIWTEQIDVRMSSPLTVYQTVLRETDKNSIKRKWTNYLAPWDPSFSRLLADNAERKWRAYSNETPPGRLDVSPLDVSPVRDKVVAKYKKSENGKDSITSITAWKGTYRLSGPPQLLDFLYHTGLGAKNSSGFGLFDVF